MFSSTIEITPTFERALQVLEDPSTSCFITGRAGTGKSTLLNYFIQQTQKNIAVLAPTGIAAINIGGQTVHSFFGFKPNVTLEEAQKSAKKILKKEGKKSIYHRCDCIVIDEVSMLRADMADCMDVFLKTIFKSMAPFGGMKMAFIGDPYQLPPVVNSAEKDIFKQLYQSPYFFSSQVLRDFPIQMIELEKIYRQTDSHFINLLNKIRNNSIDDEEIRELNRRLVDEVPPHEDGLAIVLTPTNQKASELNKRQLAALPGQSRKFKAEIGGEIEKSSHPTEEVLELKKGCQVMLLNNDSQGRWVNGTMGIVKGFDGDVVLVELENGELEEVVPFNWEIFHYDFDLAKKKMVTQTVGQFKQHPLKLAWALTIHKSQGKTFDRVVLDLDRGTFAPGQLYVALSRCRSLGGLYLTTPVHKRHVMLDWDVVRFMTGQRYGESEKEMPMAQKENILKEAIQSKKSVEIVYLKGSDVKSTRTILPLSVGPMEYSGKIFPGLRAFCETRGEERTFRVDRILEMRVVGE